MAAIVQPTRGQVYALGFLMINKFVTIEHLEGIYPLVTYSDMSELVQMSLCHKRYNPFRWCITSKLLKEWEPFVQLTCRWREFNDIQRQASHALSVLSNEPFRYATTIALAEQTMEKIAIQCGSALASNWLRWKYEQSEGVWG